MRTAFYSVVVVGLLCAGSALAQEVDQDVEFPVHTFFLSDIAEVQPLWSVQVSSGVRFSDTDTGTALSVPTSLDVGVAERVQLSAEVPWVRETGPVGTRSNIPEVELGGDYRLVDSPRAGFALSAGLAVQAPTSTGVREDFGYTLAPRVRAYKDLGAIGISAEAAPGVTITRGSELSPNLEVGAGISVGEGDVVPTVEGHAETGDISSARASAGVRFKPWEPVEVGVAAIGGTEAGSQLFGGALDLVVELGR